MTQKEKFNPDLKNLSSTHQFALIWVIFNLVNFVSIEILSITSELKKRNIFAINVALIVITIFYLQKNLSLNFKVRPNKEFLWQKLVIGILFLGSLISGYAVAPNNWDSMTYHLGRILHWYQNGNLNHFDATISRQNYVSPFGDFQSLIFLSANSDRFAFLPSFISGLLIIGIFYALCTFLNLPPKIIFIGIFFILAPNFVSQISTTQVDLRSLAFVMIGVYLLIRGGPLSTFMGIVAFGLSFGTKFLSLLPLFGLLFFPSIRDLIINNIKRNPKSAFTGLVLGALINVPWLLRNYDTFGNFTGESGHIFALNSSLTLRTIDIFRYFSTNIMYYEVPVYNDLVARKTNELLNLFFNDNQNLVPFGLSIDAVAPIPTEDDVSSFVLFFALSLIFIYLLVAKKFMNSLVFLSPLAITFVFLAWQPWINRLLVSSFVFMVFFGIYFVNKYAWPGFRRYIFFLSILSLFTSCLYLIDNDRRGLAKIFYAPTNRVSDYFIPRPGLAEDYKLISSLLTLRNIRYAAVIGIEDSWEYPLLVMNPRVSFIPEGSALAEYGVCLDACEALVKSPKTIVLQTKNGLMLYKTNN